MIGLLAARLPIPAAGLAALALGCAALFGLWQRERARSADLRAGIAQADADALALVNEQLARGAALSAELARARAVKAETRVRILKEIVHVADPNRTCGPGVAAALDRLRSLRRPHPGDRGPAAWGLPGAVAPARLAGGGD